MRQMTVLTVVILLAASSAAAAEWQLGFQGGMNSSGLSGDSPSDVSLGKKSGLAAGLIVDIRVGEDVWFSAQPMFLQRGATSKIVVSGEAEKQEGPSLSLDYFAIPILAKIFSDNGRTYVVGGLNPAFLLDAEEKEDEVVSDTSSTFKSFDLAADIGFGVLFPVGRPTINVEFRYEQSILNLAASDGQDSHEVFPERFRSSGIQILAGLIWPLGGK